MGQQSLPVLPKVIIRGLLDNRYEGSTVVDREGIILYISKSTERYFGLKANEAVGKHVTKVFPDTNLHEVAKTGKAEIGVTVEVYGQKKVVSRIPIMDGLKVVGAISKIMFKDVDSMMHALVGSLGANGIGDYFSSGSGPQVSKFPASYNIVGRSRRTTEIRDFAQMASRTSSNVLITGETGCGKEVVARAIHNLSPRKAGRFVSVNCSAIPHHLFESEFFGYAPGAFTGAVKQGKDGLFRLAHNGTIFLDEIAELPLEMQPKMLRVLQEKTFYRVGGKRKIDVDFRLICATNKDLEELVGSGKFRQDLFFRINVLNIQIPPLRERTDDIPDLAYFLLFRLLKNMESKVTGISPEVLKMFQKYSWRGNVRELDNV
ncbi:MAG: sigma 54-interacting transcriptional regulator, partial [Proteobacteria bacterium]|nr:sigma 54-interacting transcriptional regulator [Pseudomonadota bacterium]